MKAWTIGNEFLNGKDKRKLKNNTYFERLGENTIGIRLHQTHVVKLHRNGTIELNTGGWETTTTRERINRILGMVGLKTRVYITKGFMHCVEATKQKIEFFDGMLISEETGRCTNYWNR